MSSFPPRECAVCSKYLPASIYQQKFAALSGEYLLTSYNVVECLDCGFCYADGIPEQAHFDRYYRTMSKYENFATDGHDSTDHSRRIAETAKIFERHLPDRAAKIVEIGCATGGLLGELQKQGYQTLLGIDPAPAISAIAARVHAVRVITGSLFDPCIDEGSVDVIILNFVLEHIRDIRPAITKLLSLLRPNGRLYITVPDASRYGSGSDAPFQEFSVEHINFFGPQSLQNLMDSFGCRLLGMELDFVHVGPHSSSPTLNGFFERVTNAEEMQADPLKSRIDHRTGDALRLYVTKSEEHDAGVRRRICDAVSQGEKLIVWGTGAHTLRLISAGDLPVEHIAAFIDSNAHYQGRTLHDIPVYGPDFLKQSSQPILISSRLYQAEIAEQIRHECNCMNPLLLLYDL